MAPPSMPARSGTHVPRVRRSRARAPRRRVQGAATARTGRCSAGGGSRRCAAVVPFRPRARRPTSSTSRTGRARCPLLEVSPNWTYGGTLQGLFGRARPTAAKPCTASGTPSRDDEAIRYARFVYIDTLQLRLRPGWKRDTGIVDASAETGPSATASSPQAPPPGYPSRAPRGPRQRRAAPRDGDGPGVTPSCSGRGTACAATAPPRIRRSTSASTGWSGRTTRSAPAER